MKTAQQRITELNGQLRLAQQICRTLLILVVAGITSTSVLAFQLHSKSVELANNNQTVIVGTGSLEKIGENMYEIVEDIEPEQEIVLPELPSHLK